MVKKKILLYLSSSVITLSPIAFIAACSQTEQNSEPTKEFATKLKTTSFNASVFDFNQSIDQALPLINQKWIIKNKEKIFTGTLKYLNSADQISNLNVFISGSSISISFKIKAKAYIDQSGQIATQTSSLMNFIIKDFPIDSDQSDLLDLNQIATEAVFSVANLNQLPSAITTDQIRWNQANENPDVALRINSLIPDDTSGKLGFNFTMYQVSQVNHQLSVNVEPNDLQAIINLQISKPTITDEQLVKKEIERLSTNNPINVSQLTTTEIAKYEQQPQLFIEHLKGLQEKEFKYQVVSFEFSKQNDQNGIIKINLMVSKQGASAKIDLVKLIKIIDINLNNPQLARLTELNRLNNLSVNSFLIQTNFSESEIKQLEENPNQILTKIFKFISQQYFHYRVVDFKIEPVTKISQTIKANLSFSIQAKFWKTVEQNQPIIKSNQFSYPILINYESEIPKPTPTPNGWEIKPTTNASEQQDGSYDLTIDLNQDQKLDLAKLDWKTDQVDLLISKIFNENKNLFINQTGDLPSNWDWNNYVTFYNIEPIKDAKDKVTGIYFNAQFDYTNSKDLEDWFLLNVKLTNGYNSGYIQQQPNVNQLWNQYLNEFKALVDKQQFDQKKFHSGFNEIYSFSQINVDKPFANDHFSNFLNFSASDFAKDRQFLIKASVSDASINYLTNTVEFRWNLEGQNQLASQTKWTSDLLTLKYEPSDWAQDEIPFDDQGDLAITNAKSINNILDRFALSNQFRSRDHQKELLERFGKNWTWKAREFANYVRFTFYQAFNDGADAINMAIENLPNVNLDQNPGGYTIILKAKLNKQAAGNYLPYLQMFGANLPASAKQWNAGDIIEIRFDVNQPDLVPDAVTNSNEIFPGMGPGTVIGKGQGAIEAYLNTPPRTDLFSIALGKTTLTIKHNGSTYLNGLNANHRFLSLNLMARYDFKDPLWNEPPLMDGWTR